MLAARALRVAVRPSLVSLPSCWQPRAFRAFSSSLDGLSHAELRKRCEAAGVAAHGTKAEMISRLREEYASYSSHEKGVVPPPANQVQAPYMLLY